MKNLSILILLFTTSYCLCQSKGLVSGAPGVTGQNNGLISSNNRYGSSTDKGLISYEAAQSEYENIDGSPFLYGKKIVVDFVFHTDSIIKDVNIKYDLYNKEIIAYKEDGSTVVINQNYYKGFLYDNEGKEELYLRLQAYNPTFYHVLFKVDDFVFCKTIKTTVRDEERRVPGQESKPKKFTHKTKYFVLNRNILTPVKLNNDGAVEYFPREYRSHVSEMKKELRIKKLRKEEDYVEVLTNIKNQE